MGTITYKIHGMTTNVDIKTFKDGSVNINLNCPEGVNVATEYVGVTARLEDPADQMALLFATRALRKTYPMARMTLRLPFMPYQRQDRACNPGEAFSMQDFGDFINMLGYDLVETYDPHSPVVAACVRNLIVIDQVQTFGYTMSFRDHHIVAPDMGAMKKAQEFARVVDAKGVICFNKTRKMSTGEITGLSCIDIVPQDGKFVVLDDLCDGGRTFVEVAKHLPDHAEKILMVTHGLFTYGMDVVLDVYDKVITTDSYTKYMKPWAELNAERFENQVKLVKIV